MANTTSTTSFKADISQLKSAMQQAQKQVSLANSEFKKATAGLDNWSQSAVGLSAKLKQLDSVLSAQKQKLSLMEQEYQKVVKVYGENSAAATKLKTDMNNQQAAIAKTEKEIDKYSEELKKAEKYGDNFDDTLEDMNDSAEDASDGFTVMKGALADLIADGIKMAVSAMKELIESTIEVGRTFEKSMASVQALSGATQEEMDLLTETAKHFGETTQFRLAHTRKVCCVSETPTCRYLQHTRVDILGGCRQGREAIGVATFEHHALVEVVAYDVVGIVFPNLGSLVGIYALGGYINFAIRGI